MPVITFEGRQYECREGYTVLEELTRQGVLLPSSCQSGACQTCMVRAVQGTPSPESQQGLKDTLKAQGCFLACVCRPREDLEIALASISEKYTAIVRSKAWLNRDVVRLRLACRDFQYFPGQFINLVREADGLVRSYSLASVPEDGELELHIKRIPGGAMSTWVCDTLGEGDEVSFYGPAGDCFYVPGKAEKPLILAGTGTGLAPLYGIIRHALSFGHNGRILLFHGSLEAAGLYMVRELEALASRHENVTYIPCVLYGDPPGGGMHGKIDDLVVRKAQEYMQGSRVFLCGDPDIVESMRKKCFLAGASSQDIHADAFTFVPAAREQD